MNDNSQSGGLLAMLNRLFSRISLLDLEKRKHSYRPQVATPHDIASRLNRDIERIAAEHVSAPAINAAVNATDQADSHAPAQAVVGSLDNDPVMQDFSSHFKELSSSSEFSPYMGDKMVSSTWSHLHTALLHARKGDVAKAKLHADIANQALREAAHYMDEEQYARFSADIEKALEALNPPKH